MPPTTDTGRVTAVAGRLPDVWLSDIQWEVVMRVLRGHGTKAAAKIADSIDAQLQPHRREWRARGDS